MPHRTRPRNKAFGRTLTQLLRVHLRDVANGARERAKETALAGWLHDLGKYRSEFQLYIRGDLRFQKGNPLTRHKEAGAEGVSRELMSLLGNLNGSVRVDSQVLRALR